MADNQYFIWAKDTVEDPISKQNNIVEPDTETKRVGLGFKPRLPRNWFNYLLNFITSRLNAPISVVKADLAGLVATRPVSYMLYVTDAAGGACIAYNDGTDYRRISDRTIVD